MKLVVAVRKLVVGQMQENCYLVENSASGEVCIIDPGDDGDYIANTIQASQSRPVAILLTHGHFDHCMAAGELQGIYDIPCFLHEADAFLVERMQETAGHFLQHVGPILIPKVTQIKRTQNVFKIGSFLFDLLHLPGHTPGSVGVHLVDEGVLFCGDVLFTNGGVGRTDFAYSDAGALVTSIKSMLALPDKTIVYSGHGEPTTVSEARKYL